MRVALLALLISLASSAPTAAQELSFSVSLDAVSYNGDAYHVTDGDRGVELALGFETSRGIRLSNLPVYSGARLESDRSPGRGSRGNISALAIKRMVSGRMAGEQAVSPVSSSGSAIPCRLV